MFRTVREAISANSFCWVRPIATQPESFNVQRAGKYGRKELTADAAKRSVWADPKNAHSSGRTRVGFLLTSRSCSSGRAASGKKAAGVSAGQSANATDVSRGVEWERRETISSDTQIKLENEMIRRSGLRLMSLL